MGRQGQNWEENSKAPSATSGNPPLPSALQVLSVRPPPPRAHLGPSVGARVPMFSECNSQGWDLLLSYLGDPAGRWRIYWKLLHYEVMPLLHMQNQTDPVL